MHAFALVDGAAVSTQEHDVWEYASHQAARPAQQELDELRAAIAGGEDPLGTALCRIRSAAARRRRGAVHTPHPIVRAMVDWAATQETPGRVVDPGAGSGRFLLQAGAAFPRADLVAIESDPLAALILRANAEVLGMTQRLTVLVRDYRDIELPGTDAPTLFLGNPPYIRHHDIAPSWKDWFASAAAAYGAKASRLAGSHIHFLLQTARLAKSGDFGTFITAAEWLDVNYGSTARKLFTDVLGGLAVHLFAPDCQPFPNAESTGAIICFRIDDADAPDERGQCSQPARGIRFRQVDAVAELGNLDGGKEVPASHLRRATRWSPLTRPAPSVPAHFVELGELCRVHRGQVTGRNAAWIAGGYRGELPRRCLLPTVTKARELFNAGNCLASLETLRRVIDLPLELDELDGDERRQVERFLHWARAFGANASYVASHRRAWWAVQLKPPAPILCTYMARRPPAFVRNPLGARHLNIAHGLYPRDALPPQTLDALARWLRQNVQQGSGRTYAGGLTKFEPKEIERLRVPPLAQLA